MQKKSTVAALIAAIVLFTSAWAVAGEVVKETITAQNTFSDSISPTYQNPSCRLNINVYGATWSATVTLQRSFKDESNETWYDVEEYTSNTEKALVDCERGNRYRIGVKTDDFTSGSVVVRLSR